MGSLSPFKFPMDLGNETHLAAEAAGAGVSPVGQTQFGQSLSMSVRSWWVFFCVCMYADYEV
jgi:hypothetical protein